MNKTMRFKNHLEAFTQRVESLYRVTPALILAWAILTLCISLPSAFAQTNISGDIAGVVTDSSGAAIPNAQISVTNQATGTAKQVTSGGRGEYRVPLLQPGSYTVSVTAPGFETSNERVTVSAGAILNGDIRLTAGQVTTKVEVTSAEPLLHTEDAQISTSYTMEQVQALPNPGNDLTFVAQTSPGAVMNTMGGFGNFSVFGLPATSNTFTVNGGYQNDPFLNLNNSGATNLLLGNNDVGDVTVTSNAYDAAFGGLGGAQVNEISRSGGNSFHGNAVYWWNGRVMNANDWFSNAEGNPRPFDNVNQWAVGIGGPIKKDKLFFFSDYEGLRIVLPTSSQVFAPTPAEVTNILASVPASETAMYQGLLNQWTNAPGYANGHTPLDGDTRFTQFTGTAGNFTHEYLITGRVDWNIGVNDKAFWHAKVDKGLQATFTSLLNPLYNADSPQPEYNGEFQETHTFSPNLTNQFLFGAEYYRALFVNTNQAAANAITPFALFAFFDTDLASNGLPSLPGGENEFFPQGRNVTNYQFADDLSWTKGDHTVKLGWSMRRDDVSDYGPGVETTPLVEETYASFMAGQADVYVQSFPNRLSQPIALYAMGAYLQDTWKALPNLTLTAGLRLEHNSNPTCLTNCFGYSNGAFSSLPDTPGPNFGINDTPFNQLLLTGRRRAFQSLQHVGYEPRVGFSWQPMGVGSKTVVRGGFGIFADVFPATVADNLLNNPPVSVVSQILGPAITGSGNPYLLYPGIAPTPGFDNGSAGTVAAAGAAAVKAQFASGGSADSIGFQPNLITTAPKIKYPTYELWNLAVERQLDRNTALSISYVGNHGYDEPVVNTGANGFQTGNINGAAFGGTPQSYPFAPPNSAFGTATVDYAGATSNYNGLITTLTHRDKYVTLQLNYAYSHALDQISNGGFLSFNGNAIAPINPYNLSQNYGNSDYDTRHYVSGSYVINVPHYWGPRVLTDGFQLAGTVFHNNGYPVSVTDSYATVAPLTAAQGGGCPDNDLAFCYGISNGSANPLAAQLSSFSSHCGGAGANSITGKPCPFVSAFGLATNFGQSERNQVFGSNYTDTDLDVTKSFKIPRFEAGSLKVGAQFFNLFNHPNFGPPDHDLAQPTIGTISTLQNTPTSILGSFLGGDASPRLIQVKASLVF